MYAARTTTFKISGILDREVSVGAFLLVLVSGHTRNTGRLRHSCQARVGATGRQTGDVLLRSTISTKDFDGTQGALRVAMDFFTVSTMIMASARSDPALETISAVAKCQYIYPSATQLRSTTNGGLLLALTAPEFYVNCAYPIVKP